MVGGGTLLIGSLIGSFVWLLVTSDLARFHIKVAILIACAAAAVVSALLIQEGGTVALVSFLVLAVTVPLRHDRRRHGRAVRRRTPAPWPRRTVAHTGGQ
jgi:hypothetical protein